MRRAAASLGGAAAAAARQETPAARVQVTAAVGQLYLLNAALSFVIRTDRAAGTKYYMLSSFVFFARLVLFSVICGGA